MPSNGEAPRAAMDVAAEYVERTRLKRSLDLQLKNIKAHLEELQEELLHHMEEGRIPESFKFDGASVFTREETWVSPLDGDHGALAHALNEVGLFEYLPSKVNSQSISAYVREHIDPETGELRIGGDDGLDPRLAARLKITRTTKAIVNG